MLKLIARLLLSRLTLARHGLHADVSSIILRLNKVLSRINDDDFVKAINHAIATTLPVIHRNHHHERGEWITADGRIVPVHELTDAHLVDVMEMLRRNVYAHYHVYTKDQPKQYCFDCSGGADEYYLWRMPIWPHLVREHKKRFPSGQECNHVTLDIPGHDYGCAICRPKENDDGYPY